MELVDFRFGESARASGCFIASGCGFDSVVADLGTIYVQRKFSATGLPSSVEAFLSLHTTTSFRELLLPPVVKDVILAGDDLDRDIQSCTPVQVSTMQLGSLQFTGLPQQTVCGNCVSRCERAARTILPQDWLGQS